MSGHAHQSHPAIVKRLKRAEGHLRSIVGMIEAGRPCADLAGFPLAASAVPSFAALLPVWFMLGIGYSMAQTPSGRLLRRSSHPEDRPEIYAAQFALSHACWLLTYPLAGWAGTVLGLPAAAAILAMLATAAILLAVAVWPADDPEIIEHSHCGLPEGHSHLAGKGSRHAHAYVIDDMHPAWPARPRGG